MTAAAFRFWLAVMKERHGWKIRDAVKALGCSPNQPRRWSENGAPAYVALACAALAAQLAPWQRELDP